MADGPPKSPRAPLPSRNVMILAAAGVLLAVAAAYQLNRPVRPLPPAFQPSANPYPKAIFANGIIESDQASGANLNVFPEVSGPVTGVFVREGQGVRAGQPLFALDDSAPRAAAEQTRLQAQAAQALAEELKAQPRRETLDIAEAQLDLARANLKTLEDQRNKLQRSAALDPRSVSQDSLDQAVDAAKAAQAAVAVAERQRDLTRAGAWSYDLRSQQAQAAALAQAYAASRAQLAKYVVKAPTDAVVLAVNAPQGGYVSPQGAYDSHTQINLPVMVLGAGSGALAVRVYVDEILLSRLPKGGAIQAQMGVRGANVQIPLQFVRIQPYVTPKIELSAERQERVDLRVLPVIFRFKTDPNIRLYPGQQVDVYISQ